ncbi:MAG: hypothetical protein EOO02_24550 [Chitinophagaceae bacterium]|nr:MAG: hypothetical protein EOO02_24550 [Chitinophagaceae bacterium]
MKPIFIRLLAFLLPLTMAESASSQSTIQTLAFSKTVLDSADRNTARLEREAAAERDLKTLTSIKTMSARLYQHFTTNFKEAYDVNMEVAHNVHLSWMIDGLRHRALYTKKGRMLHKLKYYDMSLLSEEVAETVYSSYPRYRIFGGVTEVQVPGHTVYFILIEDKKTWKRVKVSGDEVLIHESYVKTPDQHFADNDY